MLLQPVVGGGLGEAGVEHLILLGQQVDGQSQFVLAGAGARDDGGADDLRLLTAVALQLEAVDAVLVQLSLRGAAAPGAGYIQAHAVGSRVVKHRLQRVRRALVKQIARVVHRHGADRVFPAHRVVHAGNGQLPEFVRGVARYLLRGFRGRLRRRSEHGQRREGRALLRRLRARQGKQTEAPKQADQHYADHRYQYKHTYEFHSPHCSVDLSTNLDLMSPS